MKTITKKELRNYNEKTGYGDSEANGEYGLTRTRTCPYDKNYQCHRIYVAGKLACENCGN